MHYGIYPRSGGAECADARPGICRGRPNAPAGEGYNTEARYNIALTETADFITWGDDGSYKFRDGRWWLVPWWANEMPKAAMFNTG